MCQHLKKCFENKSISLFPVKKTRRAERRVKSEDSIEVFCDCRMLQLPGVDMIQCSKCKEWFHVKFRVQVPSKVVECTKEDWFCCQCQ